MEKMKSEKIQKKIIFLLISLTIIFIFNFFLIRAQPALNLRLSKTVLTVITGNRTSFIAFVNNIGTDTVESVNILIDGIPLNWVETTPSMTDITPKQTKEYLVMIKVSNDSETGIYELNVKAADKVESNTEILTLIIGRDPKEIADLLITEMNSARSLANQSLLVEECIDISLIKSMYHDAEIARENGLSEYQAENYVSAINWFEYAITKHEQVISGIKISVRSEIFAVEKSSIFKPPGINIEDQLNQVQNFLNENRHEKICDNLTNCRNLIMYGFIFWPLLVVIPLILIILLIINYRKHRQIERDKKIAEIKERLIKSDLSRPTHIYPRFITQEKIKKLFKSKEESTE